MRVFGFDLPPYPERRDHLKVDGELPYPLPRKQGAMPHEMFVRQIRRFAAEVLPDLRAHTVTKVAVA